MSLALVTVFVLLSALNRGGSPNARASVPFSESPAVPLPANGWYVVHPVNGESAKACLTIRPDIVPDFAPTLTQERCDDADNLQRMHFEVVQSPLYTIKAYDTNEVLKCLAVVSSAGRTRIQLRPCNRADARQQFTVSVAGGASRGVFRLLPRASGHGGNCVGLGRAAATASPQALPMKCAQSGVRGLVLAASTAPDFLGG